MGSPDVGLVQQNAVHIDAVALIVNVHRLSAGGNDALNDSYAAQVLHRGLVEHHDVPLLRLIAQRPNQQELLVLKSIGHGLPCTRVSLPIKVNTSTRLTRAVVRALSQ